MMYILCNSIAFCHFKTMYTTDWRPLCDLLCNLCAGDTVVYGKDTATVVIEANDDANGIFSLDSTEKPVEEGKSNSF